MLPLVDEEQALAGGNISTVVRVGDTVRCTPGRRSGYVRELLVHLEERGWPGAPRHLGRDGRGREVLGFLDGYVPWQDPPRPEVRAAPAVTAVAALVRQLHDLPVAFIDWDIAGPGDRVQDVAHTCWQFVPLGSGTDVDRAARLVRAVADGYDGSRPVLDRTALLPAVLWWQDRCWRGIDAAAEAGDAAMVGLRASGAVRTVRAAYDWVLAHRAEIEAALA